MCFVSFFPLAHSRYTSASSLARLLGFSSPVFSSFSVLAPTTLKYSADHPPSPGLVSGCNSSMAFCTISGVKIVLISSCFAWFSVSTFPSVNIASSNDCLNLVLSSLISPFGFRLNIDPSFPKCSLAAFRI